MNRLAGTVDRPIGHDKRFRPVIALPVRARMPHTREPEVGEPVDALSVRTLLARGNDQPLIGIAQFVGVGNHHAVAIAEGREMGGLCLGPRLPRLVPPVVAAIAEAFDVESGHRPTAPCIGHEEQGLLL